MTIKQLMLLFQINVYCSLITSKFLDYWVFEQNLFVYSVLLLYNNELRKVFDIFDTVKILKLYSITPWIIEKQLKDYDAQLIIKETV